MVYVFVELWDYVSRGLPGWGDHSVAFEELDIVTLENADIVAHVVDRPGRP